MSEDLKARMAQIAQLGQLSQSEARLLLNEIYSDGIVSREEAEALFRLNSTLAAPGPDWTDRFVEIVKDFLLLQEAPAGWVTEEETDWLISQIGRDGHLPNDAEIDLMLSTLRYADGAPVRLSHFCLDAIANRIIEAGFADDEMTERMRRILHAPAGDGSISISRHEANVLFRTNDAIGHALNSKSWENVFAKAVLNHLVSAAHPDPQTEEGALTREAWLRDTDVSVGGFLGRMSNAFISGKWFDRVSYSEESAARARYYAANEARRTGAKITGEESQWFLKRLGWDKSITPAERRLVNLMKEDVPAFARGLSEALREDGLRDSA
ncbi:hypothetical protein [Henriciella barbarensis]|nr:hypothetical protein [Henriciella barbarensis]